MGKLEGKVAVITGGNSGIGLAIAESYIAEGARVAIFGRNQQRNVEALERLGDNAISIRGDVTKLTDLDTLFLAVAEEFGRIDIVVANAGAPLMSPFLATGIDSFEMVFDTNVKGAFYTVQKAVPHLSKSASVILVTSGTNTKGLPGMSAYSASKAALRSLARSMSAELVGRGVRVNALSPGVIDTPMLSKAGLPQEGVAGVVAMIPMKRMGRPEEIASAAVFLGSDDSSYVVGAEIVVDGGTTQL